MIGTGQASATPVTAVVLTFNEERNLAACLESLVSWTAAVFVVDSGSSDATVRMAERAGATVVSHPFETHAAQWKWALATLPIATEWVLAIDADQRVTPELAAAIARLADSPGDAVGAYVNRRQIFRGKWIRHGGYYPKFLLKLFKRSRVTVDTEDLVDHHFRVDGPTTALRADLVEDNRNEAEIAVWTAKHNRYAVLQARQELMAAGRPKVRASSLFGSPDARVLYLKQVWARLPLYWRPCLYVFYRYVLRLGFLDGKQGFVFHVLQAFWYRLLVDVNVDELRARGLQAPSADPSMDTTGPIGVEAPRR